MSIEDKNSMLDEQELEELEIEEFETEEILEERKPSKKSKSSFKIIVIGTLVVVFGGVGFYLKNKISEISQKGQPDLGTKTMKIEPQTKAKKEANEKGNIKKKARSNAKKEVSFNAKKEVSFVVSDSLMKKKKEERHENSKKLSVKKLSVSQATPLARVKAKKGYNIPPTPEEISRRKGRINLGMNKTSYENSYRERILASKSQDATKKIFNTKREKKKKLSELPLPDNMKLKETRNIEEQAFGLDALQTEKTSSNGGVCLSKRGTWEDGREYVYYMKKESKYIPAFESEDWDGRGIRLDKRIVSLSTDNENGLVEIEDNKFLPIELFASCSIFTTK